MEKGYSMYGEEGNVALEGITSARLDSPDDSESSTITTLFLFF
jgi:hypothetical protein